jgi:O-antigen/teichoic acid export membrane protein
MPKSIVQNAVFNIAYKALSVFFPLITVSYASRKLGASGIGTVSSAQNLVTYFIMFAALGIPSYGVRAIAQQKKEKVSCNKTFTELFLINFLSTVVCTLAYFEIASFVDSTELRELHIIFASLIILNIFNIEWVYQGFEEYRFIAIRSFFIKGISLLFLIFFVRKSGDLLIYAAIICFGTVGNYFLNMIQLRKHVQFDFHNLSFSRHFKVIMTFFASVIAIELYSLLDLTMLTYMTSAEHVGYYSNAVKIIKTLQSSITAIGAVLLPRLSVYYSENNFSEIERVTSNFFRAIIFISVPSCLGMILVADKLVPVLFGNDFLPAILTTQLLSPLILLMPLSGGVFGQMLLTTNRERSYLLCVCIGPIVNVMLNFIFIRLWQQNGAAIASIITETIVSGAMIVVSRKIAKLKINAREFLSIGIAAFTMATMICLIRLLHVDISAILSLIIEIGIGIVTYFLVLVVFKNEIMLYIIMTIRKKIC